jgi:hypothetical protein
MSTLTPAELTAGAMLAAAARHNVASNSLRVGIIRCSLILRCNADFPSNRGPKAAACKTLNLILQRSVYALR